MNVLIGCEFSGVVRDAFRRRGHDAWSCDLEDIEAEGEWSNYHLYGNILWWLDETRAPVDHWDLLIAHPPCTYLCNSGVKWLYKGGRKENGKDPTRWYGLDKAAEFFCALRDAPIPKKAIENPILHGYALKAVGRPSQIIQPWQFGHGETKATCLWLEKLPKLRPTKIVAGRMPRVHYASPGPDRWKERSRTLPGIAEAMAEQWG